MTHKNRDGATFKSYYVRGIKGLVPVNIEVGILAQPYQKLGETEVGEIDIEL